MGMLKKMKDVVCSIPKKIGKMKLAAFLFLACIMSSFATDFNFITKTAEGELTVDVSPILSFLETSLLTILGAGMTIFIIWLVYQVALKAIKKVC